MKILLVEDDEVTRFLNIRTLLKSGVNGEILTASNGQEAYEILLSHCTNGQCSLDLILLDINMPIMDGFEFLDAFNRMDLSCPPKVVLLSSSTHAADLERAKQYSVEAVLTKPLTGEMLAAIFDK